MDGLILDEVINPTVLKDRDLLLMPSTLRESADYILKMACKDRYNKTPREELSRGLQFVKYVWICKNSDGVGGVVFMCYLDHMNWWTLDAYKDESVDNKSGDWSYRSARLVIDWFFESHREKELHTLHRTDNHAATKMCERLGFEKKYLNPEFIILSLRRSKWASRQF